MNIKLIALMVLLAVIAGAGGGGWYYVNNAKVELKAGVGKQVSALGKLREKIDGVTTIYQDSSTLNKDSSNTKVLGAKTSIKKKDQIGDVVGHVLGIEDNKLMQSSRDVIELLNQAMEDSKKISDDNLKILTNSGLPLLKMTSGVALPTDKTDKMLNDLSPILEVLKKEGDLTIKAYSLSTDLVATLVVAIQVADEPSVKKLEQKISDLETLVADEKKLQNKNVPNDLKDLLKKSSAQLTDMLVVLKEIPDVMRKRDAKALMEKGTKISNLGKGDDVEIQTSLVSFMKGNETIRSIETIRVEWDELGKKL